jgi:hypothetical protein
MRVTIRRDGHAPPFHHVTVDGHGIPIDLSQVKGSLHDPTISYVDWGVVRENGELREGGHIVRDGEPEPKKYFDRAALAPYLDAYERRKAELLHALPA